MKTAIITGGSRGLGLALAAELLQRGSKVCLLARDQEELARAEEKLLQKFPHAELLTLSCDVTDEAQVSAAFTQAIQKFGEIRLLINNAGSILVGPFESMRREDFEAQMELHVYAVIFATRLICEHFRQYKIRGRIVNICSMGGKVGVPHMLPYDTSKFALAGFSQGVAAELSSEGISVTTVYPALMQTGSPIQAVFKGDWEKEFAWFAAADSMPGFSLEASTAARRIVAAAQARRAELVPSWIARTRLAAGILFPESMAQSMALLARFLPKGSSTIPKTGAQSRRLFDQLPGLQILSRISRLREDQWNQKPKSDAAFNMGLKASATREL